MLRDFWMDTQWVISMCVFSVTIFREILEMTTCLHTRGGGGVYAAQEVIG